MMYGLRADDDQRVLAEPGVDASCPQCREALRAKCGEIVTWHWAHVSLHECDPWWEPESEWHRAWKRHVPPECAEATIGAHRADIAIGQRVLELQHSSISPETIREREQFYKGAMGREMVWLFDVREAVRAGRFTIEHKTHHSMWQWAWARKSVFTCRCPVFLDLGAEGVLAVRWKRRHVYAGAGVMLEPAEFVRRVLYGQWNERIAEEAQRAAIARRKQHAEDLRQAQREYQWRPSRAPGETT